MNQEKIYPWIFVAVFAVIGLIVCMKVGSIYEELANDASWTFWGGSHISSDNDIASNFDNSGILSSCIIFFSLFMLVADTRIVANDVFFGCLFGFMGGFMFWVAIILIFCKNSISIAGTCSGVFIGVVTGLLIGILTSILKKEINLLFISILIFGIVGIIIGRVFCNDGLIICSPLLLSFASVGYAIGTPIKEKAEHRAEIRKREKHEREKKTREEERLIAEQRRREQESVEQERLRREEEERHRKEAERRRAEKQRRKKEEEIRRAKQEILDMIEEVKAER